MTAEFVPLADLLRGGPSPSDVPPQIADAPVETLATVTEPDASDVAPRFDRFSSCDDDADAAACALRDARLFRARLADALDAAVVRLVRDVAADVLARELRLAPCDIASLVQRARDRAPVVRVRVAPQDAAHVSGSPGEAANAARICGVPVVADPSLTDGDAIVELVNGALDARLGVRLAIVLEQFA